MFPSSNLISHHQHCYALLNLVDRVAPSAPTSLEELATSSAIPISDTSAGSPSAAALSLYTPSLVQVYELGRTAPVHLLAPKALQAACRSIVRVSRLAAVCETTLRALVLAVHQTHLDHVMANSASSSASSPSFSSSSSSSSAPAANVQVSPLSTHAFWLNVLLHFEPPEMLQDEFISV